MPRILSGFFGRSAPAQDIVGTPVAADDKGHQDDPEKHDSHPSEDGGSPTPPHSDGDGEEFTEGAQEGVQAMEAMTTVWTKWTLAAALTL